MSDKMTMIERVARVICVSHGGDNNCCGKCTIRIVQTKAVIEAMREPTEVMLEAADKSEIYAEGYRNMIEAALKDA